MNDVLAFHIVWTAYGTWLSGDERGWVQWGRWEVRAPDSDKEHQHRERMREPSVLLSDEQRAIVEKTIVEHCRIRGWTLHALKMKPAHVHVVITADRKGQEVRDQFKAWCSRKLSDAAGLTETVAKGAGRRHWFTEGGDCEHIDSEEYLQNAIRYVEDQ